MCSIDSEVTQREWNENTEFTWTRTRLVCDAMLTNSDCRLALARCVNKVKTHNRIIKQIIYNILINWRVAHSHRNSTGPSNDGENTILFHECRTSTKTHWPELDIQYINQWITRTVNGKWYENRYEVRSTQIIIARYAAMRHRQLQLESWRTAMLCLCQYRVPIARQKVKQNICALFINHTHTFHLTFNNIRNTQLQINLDSLLCCVNAIGCGNFSTEYTRPQRELDSDSFRSRKNGECVCRSGLGIGCWVAG